MPLRILIVDDHIEDAHKLISELPDKLRKEGYDVRTTAHSSEAYDLVWEYRPHLVVLDVLFPRQVLQGLDILKSIREQEKLEHQGRTLILLISKPKNETEDILVGLNSGADDYAAHKDNREILARIRRLLPPPVYQPDDFLAIQLAKRKVYVRQDGIWREVDLTRTQFDLLEILITNAGRSLSKTFLKITLRAGDDEYMSDTQLFKIMCELRSALRPYPGHPDYVENIRDFGYRFKDDLTRTGPLVAPTGPLLSSDEDSHIQTLSELLGLPQVQVTGYRITESTNIQVRIRSILTETACPACGQRTQQTQGHDELLTLRDLPNWGRRCWLSYKPRRFVCPACRSTFVEQVQWCETSSAYTTRYFEHIRERVRHEEIAWIADSEGLSQEMVQRIAAPSAKDTPGGTIASQEGLAHE
jgi:DNA-binding response OmpR family regulator